MSDKNKKRMYFVVKRCIDVFSSVTGIIMLAPFILLIAIAIAIDSPGPVLFTQSRTGLKGKVFKVLKFRTMRIEGELNGRLLEDKERITELGSFLRKTSLDELPQLINVFKGEMSLVGPRPLLPQYWNLYSDFQRRRHEVRPGITGLAQVMGRNAISWEQKFEFDVKYVDNLSVRLDIFILFKTFSKVITAEGINESNDNTMKPYKGSGENTNE